MPTLKQLTCTVEWDGSPSPLDEFQTAYSDGYVETYIAVPDGTTPFSVRLRSDSYIAPGLSMFVYMDGVYQCNRNRQKLKPQEQARSKIQTEVDFVVRQKEQMLESGAFIGRPWRFNRVNAASDFGTALIEPAPHNGEYIGTIEVVVLRCFRHGPETTSLKSAMKPGTAQSSSSANAQSAIVSPSTAVTSNASAESQPKRKSKHRAKAKSKAKNQPMDLDGSWDDLDPSKTTAGEAKKAEFDPWDNFTMPHLATEDPSSKSWDKSGDPPVAANESKNVTIEMTSANEGIYHPVNEGKKAESQTGSQAGTPKGSRRDKANETSSKTGQQSPASVHLRGGGPASQSITSRRTSGRDSPLVVNNSIVYNGVGTPPPLSAGPPAARHFWKDMDAIQAAKNVSAHITHAPNAKAKVDDWNAGPSSMPGSWDNSKETKKDNDGWGTFEDKPQGNNDWPSVNEDDKAKDGNQDGDTSGNVGDASDWNQAADSGGWDFSNGQTNQNGNDSKGDDKAGNQEDNNWGNFDSNTDTQANDWNTGNVGDHEQNDDGTNEAPAPGSPSKGTRFSDKNNKPQAQSPCFAKGSKTGSVEKLASPKPQATPNQTKGQPSIFNWFNRFSKNVPENKKPGNPAAAGKKTSSPGAWSPPMVSKKEAPPLAAEPIVIKDDAQAQPHVQSSNSPSTAPKVKPYWSTWKEPSTSHEKPTKNAGSGLAEAPIYTISEDLLERNKTTHQVRPSHPVKYSHKTSKPHYMDTFKEPYAVFVFKYRDRETIEAMSNTIVTKPEVDEKARLSSLPKDQLVDELLKVKSQSSSGSRHSSDKGTYKSNPLGISMSPNASALTQKLSKLESSWPPTPEKVGGWLDSANENGNDKADAGTTRAEDKKHEADSNEGGNGNWGAFDTNFGNGGGDNWGKGGEEIDGNAGGNTWETVQEATADNAWNNNNDFSTGGDKWNTNKPTDTSAQKDETSAGDGWGFNNDNEKNDNASPKPDAAAGGSTDNAWPSNDNKDGNDWNTTEEKKDEEKKTEETKKDDDWTASGFGGLDTSW